MSTFTKDDKLRAMWDALCERDDRITELEDALSRANTQLSASESDVERLEARIEELKEYETPCHQARDALLQVVSDIEAWRLWGWEDRLRAAFAGVDKALGILEEA